jgi:hypothetical protein
LGVKLLKKAMEEEGTPYVYGGGSCSGPTKGGYDCSGLVLYALCKVTGRNWFTSGPKAESLRRTGDMYCARESKLKYKYAQLPLFYSHVGRFARDQS